MTVLPDDPRLTLSSFAAVSERSAVRFRPSRAFGGAALGTMTPCGRLAFLTDACTLELDVQSFAMIDGVGLFTDGLTYQAELLIDGLVTQGLELATDGSVQTMRLDDLRPGTKLVELIWPTLQQMDLLALRLDMDSLSNAAVPARRMVCGGDSITQGQGIVRPTASWPFRLSRALNLELVNMGYSGRPAIPGDGARDGALGGVLGTYLIGYNDWFISKPIDQFEAEIDLYMTDWFAASTVADAKLVMISTIFCSGEDRRNANGDQLHDYREAMRRACDRQAAVRPGRILYVDGLSIMTHAATHVPDGVHPGEIGVAEMAAGLEPLIRLFM